MNVLHLDEQTSWRGGEQQASWLIQGLVKQGHHVLIAGKPGGAFLNADHGGAALERIPLPFLGEFDLWTAAKLARVVRREKIQILHAHSSHAHSIAVCARKIAGRGKVVVSRRVSFPPKDHVLNRWKYAQPDLIIAVSGKVGEVMRAFGVPESHLAVIHSSVDLERLNVEPMPRAGIGVPEDALLLVSAGALVGHKDHETLVAAMPKVLARFPNVRLLIAGEGELRPAIEARMAALGVQDAVTLLGHRNDVPRLIRAADLYVSSSWSEGLGTSVLEALACETPVAATVAGGVPEMVRPGETGFLVPNRDPEALAAAIIESLGNREQARAMARNGRRLVEEMFMTRRMIERSIAAYDTLLREG